MYNYQEGKLYFGDCLDILPEIQQGSVDMILSDLPYGTTACSWDSVISFEKLWEHYDRVVKDHTPIVLTASQPFTSSLVMSNPSWFRHEWIWEKHQGTNPLMSEFAPMKCHESVLVFSRKRCNYYPIMEKGKPYKGFKTKNGKQIGEVYNSLKSIHNDNSGIRFPRSVRKWKQDKFNFHPTQKPVDMFSYLIETYSIPGEIVLDNSSGSGTTAIASIMTGRKFICIENNDKYFQVMKKRIEHFIAINNL